jgi:hypothetical protein
MGMLALGYAGSGGSAQSNAGFWIKKMPGQCRASSWQNQVVGVDTRQRPCMSLRRRRPARAQLRHPAGWPAKLWKEAMDICVLGFGLVAVVTGHTSPIFLDLFVLKFCATEGEF